MIGTSREILLRYRELKARDLPLDRYAQELGLLADIDFEQADWLPQHQAGNAAVTLRLSAVRRRLDRLEQRISALETSQ